MTDIMWFAPENFQEALDCPYGGEFTQQCLTAFVAGMQMNGLQPEGMADENFTESVINLIEAGVLEMGVTYDDEKTTVYMASAFSDADPQPIAEITHVTEH